ncbi:MAG: aminotransferase class I/II-fold pyridoxal phosphate-dependent enzyme [Candidatus Nealsonbacteria bacterium]|nr:aminotransferase class I/II-fold pyridoxal phosphate-dependent enzyme [Candidatus Nealsonbacteria bacterium]
MKKTQTKLRVPTALAVFGKPEIRAVNEVLSNPTRIAPGNAVKEFERRIARLFSKKYGVMVNSGSSANLLALSVLDLPRGSEVITPILTFATTVAPIVQKGLIPVFVDVKEGTYLANIDQIESLITKKTKALMIPSLIGNIPDLSRLQEIARKHKLYLIEDSCDTIGATFKGKPTGYYTDISVTSFYASHIITTAGAGGMVCFNDPQLARRALVMSSWGRESTLFGTYEKSEDIKKRFSGMLGGGRYDAKFIFSEIGYNFQSAELNGAFGLQQLNRLKGFIKRRQSNFSELINFFKPYQRFFMLPKQDTRVKTNWLIFPLLIREGAPFSRYELTKYLEENNIQTRPVFTGDILKQPAFQKIEHGGLENGYPVANQVMKNAFLIGCHQGLEKKHLRYLKKTFVDFLENYR